MTKKQAIIDFPKSAADFLTKLARNNNKAWFEEHREEFQTHLFIPAQMYVNELGERLKSIAPEIIAIPKTDKSIFRMHRDIRFSKDKSPYKANLGMLFWEGTRKKMECSGFYIHVEPKLYFCGTGMYVFTEDQLKKFREIISNEHRAEELTTIMKKLEKKGYTFGGKTLKKTPRNYDKDYPYAHLYLYTGFYCGFESKNMKDIFEGDFVEYSFKIFKGQLPLHQWLVANLA